MTKDYGRKLSAGTKSDAEHHTANTIYYVAIAHALVYHDLKITQYSYKDLQQSLSQLSEEDWIPQSLRDFFTKAFEYCGSKMR